MNPESDTDDEDWLLPRDVPSFCFSPEEDFAPETWAEWLCFKLEGALSFTHKVYSLLHPAKLKLTMLFFTTVVIGFVVGWSRTQGTCHASSFPEFSVSYPERLGISSDGTGCCEHSGEDEHDEDLVSPITFPEPKLLQSRNWKLLTRDTYNDLQSQLKYHLPETWAMQIQSLTNIIDATLQDELARFSQCQDLWHHPSNMANEKLKLVTTLIQKKRDEVFTLLSQEDEEQDLHARYFSHQNTHWNVEALDNMASLLAQAAREQVEKIEKEVSCFRTVEWMIRSLEQSFYEVKGLVPTNGALGNSDSILADLELIELAIEFAVKEANQIASFFQNHLDQALLVYHDIQTEQRSTLRWLEGIPGSQAATEKEFDVLGMADNLLSQGRLLSRGTGNRLTM